MKKLLFLIALFLISVTPVSALPDTVQEVYEASGVQEVFPTDSSTVFDSFDAEHFMNDLSEGKAVDTGFVFNTVIDYIFKTLKKNIGLCLAVISVGYIMGFYSNIQLGIGGKGASESGYLVVYCVFSGIVATAFSGISDVSAEITENLAVMVKSLMPILIMLLTTSGGVVSGGLLASVLIGIANFVLLIIEGIVMPLIFCSFAVSIAGNMSDKIKLTKAVPFIHKIIKWVLLFVMAAFGSLFSIYGLTGSTMDATTGKLMRFAIGSGVPLVGNIAADSFESVLATLSVSRNLVGVTGIVVILVTILGPILETAVMMWIFKLCAVIMEPFSDNRAICLLSDTSECITMLFAVLVSVGLIFIGGIGVILVAGNFTLG